MRLVEYSNCVDCFTIHMTRKDLETVLAAFLHGTFNSEMYYKLKQMLEDNKCVNNSSD